jgi:hypothetical protein
MEGEGQTEREHNFQVDECSEGEMTGGEQWDLEPLCRSPGDRTRPLHLAEANRRRPRARSRAVPDQQWEEVRYNAWLRQLLSDDSTDEDEDEERYGRFAESGRWMTELYGIPQHPTAT